MKRMKYRETLTGKIPEDWEVVRLIDIADYINGYAFSPKEWKDKGFPIIRIQNLNDPEAEFNYFDGEIDDKYIVETGDLLFSWSASIGVYIWNRGKAVLNQHIFKVVPKENVDKLYFYYALYLAIEQLKNRVHGSTMKHFKRSELRTTFVLLPPLLEQKKIAEILSTVDKAIQKVDEIIAKTERLKKGLMQKLLTKGIGHKEFKYSKELGCEIPKEWEVVRLKDICIINPEQIDPRIQMPNRTFLYIDIRSVEEGRIKEYKEILGKNAPVRARRVIHKNDVIMSTVRPYLKAFALVPEQYDGQICSTGFAILKCNQNKINPHYLLYTLLFDKSIDQCKAMMVGGQYPALNQSQVENLKIPLPPLQEQQKIAEILSTIDKKLELERKRKEKFDKIKKGLMNDLLTGRKRVKLK